MNSLLACHRPSVNRPSVNYSLINSGAGSLSGRQDYYREVGMAAGILKTHPSGRITRCWRVSVSILEEGGRLGLKCLLLSYFRVGDISGWATIRPELGKTPYFTAQ